MPTNTAIVGDDALIVPHRKIIVCSGGAPDGSPPTGNSATPSSDFFPRLFASSKSCFGRDSPGRLGD
ncbi:MAG: hypothetical protein FWD58_02955, partial [Firmicutes bacterium]|nr:hypothetical protein [Bacillota bacterium]